MFVRVQFVDMTRDLTRTVVLVTLPCSPGRHFIGGRRRERRVFHSGG